MTDDSGKYPLRDDELDDTSLELSGIREDDTIRLRDPETMEPIIGSESTVTQVTPTISGNLVSYDDGSGTDKCLPEAYVEKVEK